MSNPFDEVRAAVQHAQAMDRAVNANADSMARLVVGRLRHVDADVVADLKRELRSFNIARRRWSNKG